MKLLVCAALLIALPSFAQEQLVPGPELNERVRLLEERRAPIEALRGRAFGLRLAAGGVYALALGGLVWTLAEAVAGANSRAAGPLSGKPYTQVVPTLWTVVATIVFAGVGAALHLGSRALYQQAQDEEADVEDELRELRRPFTVDTPAE